MGILLGAATTPDGATLTTDVENTYLQEMIVGPAAEWCHDTECQWCDDRATRGCCICKAQCCTNCSVILGERSYCTGCVDNHNLPPIPEGEPEEKSCYVELLKHLWQKRCNVPVLEVPGWCKQVTPGGDFVLLALYVGDVRTSGRAI